MFLPNKLHAGHWKGQNVVFVPDDFELHTRPSEGPNTSSVWIWHKSIQRFRDISYTQKKPHTDGAKNRNFHSSLGVV